MNNIDYKIGIEFLVVRDFAHNLKDRFEYGKIKKGDKYKIIDINTESNEYLNIDPGDVDYVEFEIIRTSSRRNNIENSMLMSINNFEKALKIGNMIKIN